MDYKGFTGTYRVLSNGTLSIVGSFTKAPSSADYFSCIASNTVGEQLQIFHFNLEKCKYSILVKLYLRWTIQVSEVTSHVCSRLVNQIEITVNEKTLETERGFFFLGGGLIFSYVVYRNCHSAKCNYNRQVHHSSSVGRYLMLGGLKTRGRGKN